MFAWNICSSALAPVNSLTWAGTEMASCSLQIFFCHFQLETFNRSQQPVILGVDGHILCFFLHLTSFSPPSLQTGYAVSPVLFIPLFSQSALFLCWCIGLWLRHVYQGFQRSLNHLLNIWGSWDMKEQSQGRGWRYALEYGSSSHLKNSPFIGSISAL